MRPAVRVNRTNPQLKGHFGTTLRSDIRFLKLVYLTNRLMRDEWDLLSYTDFAKNDTENKALRMEIGDEINTVFKRIRNAFKSIGHENAAYLMENLAVDMADEIEVTTDTVRTRIRAALTNKMQYTHIDQFARLTMVYIFAGMGNELMRSSTMCRQYRHIIELVGNLSDRMHVDLYQGIEGIRYIVNDDTVDIINNMIFKVVDKKIAELC